MNDKSPPLTTSLGFGISPRPKAGRGRKDDISSQTERKARVLLVDGDVESRRLMTTRLTTANYSVESVDSAEAALDACVRSRPNLVVTDLHLRAMDGLGLLNELKSRWPAVLPKRCRCIARRRKLG